MPETHQGRRIAIGDIHGCLKTLRALLFDQLGITKEDQIFFLGDYVDRGPDSEGVLNLLHTLKNLEYQITTLLGNHEEMYLDDYGGSIPYHHAQMIRSMPRVVELDDYLLVHGGFNFAIDAPLSDELSLIWGPRKYLPPDPAFTRGRKIICGHRPTTEELIRAQIEEDEPIIIIDNGCYKALEGPANGLGKLCALNLDTMDLIFQENIEESRYRGKVPVH